MWLDVVGRAKARIPVGPRYQNCRCESRCAYAFPAVGIGVAGLFVFCFSVFIRNDTITRLVGAIMLRLSLLLWSAVAVTVKTLQNSCTRSRNHHLGCCHAIIGRKQGALYMERNAVIKTVLESLIKERILNTS